MRPGGEYRDEGERDQSVWELREFFLQKVAEIAPEVLEDLRADALPVFENAYEATQPPPEQVGPATTFGEVVTREEPPEWIGWSFRDEDWEDVDDCPEELVTLRDRLYSWAENNNLQEPWVLDSALRTLTFWYNGGSSARGLLERLNLWNRVYSHAAVKEAFAERDLEAALEGLKSSKEARPLLRFAPYRFTDVMEAPPFTFKFEGWSPQDSRWRKYEQDLRDAFEKELERYKRQRRQRPEERDLDSPSEIRAPYHFDWLVLWQVQERSYREIASEYDDVSTYETPTGLSSSAVREGVHDKAQRIGLRRRKQ